MRTTSMSTPAPAPRQPAGPITARCELTGTPRAPGEARRFTREHLNGHPRLDDVLLTVSELVTNAVRHSASADGGAVTVVLAEVSGGVRVEVTDAGSPGPGPMISPGRPAREAAESGQGLFLVAEVTGGHWGHHRNTAGCTVWACIPI